MDSKIGVAEQNTVSTKGIRKKVKNSESIALQRYKIDSYNLTDLDKVLSDVYSSFRPVSADYDIRKELVKMLNAMAMDIYGNSKDSCPILEPYGSFVMDVFSRQSDLDVSINFGDGTRTSELSRDTKLQVLRRFALKLRSLQGQGHVKNVESIWGARVPIVRFVDQGTAIECDLSVENKDGILNSQIIHIISQIDDRFQKLSMLNLVALVGKLKLYNFRKRLGIYRIIKFRMSCLWSVSIKHWAKAQDVNSALHHTLNSVSITMLVAHHLQTQDPPILPPFSVLFKDGIDPPNVQKRTQKFLNWGQRNKESLGRLFVTFFVKLQSVEFLWRQGLCVSLLNGLWISKKWKKAGGGSISVEDFIDVSQNVARRVNAKGAQKIYGSINRTVNDLFEFLNGKIAGTHLRNRLFDQQVVVKPPLPPPDVPPLNVYPQQPHNNYRNGFSSRPEEHQNKRVRLENGYRAVEGSAHAREEEIYENLRGKRNRYAGNCNGFEEFHEIPRFGIHNKPLEDPYRQVSLNGGANGHLVHHRHDGRFSGVEPMVVGLWRDYSRLITDLPPDMPLPPPPYDRVLHEKFGPQNYPQPYFGRQFYY